MSEVSIQKSHMLTWTLLVVAIPVFYSLSVPWVSFFLLTNGRPVEERNAYETGWRCLYNNVSSLHEPMDEYRLWVAKSMGFAATD